MSSIKPSLDLATKQRLKQTYRLMMSPQMQQAIAFLQVPIQELSTLIETAIEDNPLLEYTYALEEEASPLREEKFEEEPDPVNNPEKELDFDDRSFELMKELDEAWLDRYIEEDFSYRQKTTEEDKRL
jgi:RNA polymerase sigma-54 factor